MGRLLRPDRARRRLRPRQHAHPRAEDRRAAIASPAPRCGSPTRRSPTCSWSGRSRTRMAARSAASCSRRACRACQRPKIKEKLSLARLDHRRDRDGRRRGRRGCAAAQRRGAEGPVRLPQPRALRHRLGLDGRGRGLLPRRAPVHARPQAVRQAPRRQPAGPAQARQHGDRDHAWACRRRCASAAGSKRAS